MSDHLPDSPIVARTYCAGCEPTADPVREVLDLRYCHLHAPTWSGVDDGAVQASAYLSGTNDAVGSEGNAAACELFHGEYVHRKKRLLTGGGA